MRGTPEYPVRDIDPFSSTITYVVDGYLWEIWGYIGDYRWYSGYGGGVFFDEGSNVTFIDCEISGNLAQGGMSGQGGEQFPEPRPLEPLIPYEIPTFGGGVYCAAESTVTFTDCTITNNIASEPNENNSHIDPYLGHGGGVCAEDTATVIFTDCTFSENEAAVGGGIHFADANPIISDCNFTFNSAFQGGGLFGEHGPATIRHSNFTNNIASSDANDPNVVILGEGGGLHFWATDADIIDCNISSNQAEASGGGVFFGGESTPSLTNCLLTKNMAGKSGGGISTDIFTSLTISNCTIAGNTGLEYGGGVYCSYNSYVDIINSIIWNNVGINGSQLAVATGFEYDPSPSTVNVSYSDVGIRPVEYELIDANGLPTIRPGFDVNSLAANDDQSTGLVDIGFGISFFGKAYSQLYVNNNGNVTFDANMSTYTPFGLTGDIGTPIIATFFADVDTRPGTVDTNALTRYGTGTVDGHASFGVTWIDVGYFGIHWDKLNSFQLILIDRSDRGPGDFDIEFNYEKIQWETGDASGGVSGFGGSSAHVGFSNGTGSPGTFYEFEGSGVPGSFLDSSPTGLIYDSRRSTVNGRYIFAVQGGLPELLSTIPIYVDVNCILDGWDWNADTDNWAPNSNWGNISEDPNFIAGYYLSQVRAGQDVNSPCVDSGSADANAPDIGLDTYTTATNSVPDVDRVDMGYHYPLFVAPQYELTVRAFDVNGLEDASLVVPNSGIYNWYTMVTLTVISPPDTNFYDILWEGTNNDDSNQPANTVTMDGDKVVTVTFVKNAYELTTEVIGLGGSVSPTGTHTYPRDMVVNLTAHPGEGYRVKRMDRHR